MSTSPTPTVENEMIPMIKHNARSGLVLASGLALAAAVLALAAACAEADSGDSRQASDEAGASAGADRSSLLVYTVNYPLAFFAERIGGDLVQVEFPAPPDVDPAFWSPDPEMVAAYQSADLILLNGAGYASWTDRASLASSRLVATTEGVTKSLVRIGIRPGGISSRYEISMSP